MLVGLAETLGDLTAALDEAGPPARRGRPGRCPPPPTRSSLKADVGGEAVPARSRSSRRRASAPASATCSSCPPTRPASPDALAAIARRRPDRARARLALHEHAGGARACPRSARPSPSARARVVQSRTSRTENETTGLTTAPTSSGSLLEHGVRVDVFAATIREHGLDGRAETDGAGTRASSRSRRRSPGRDGQRPRSATTGEGARRSAVVQAPPRARSIWRKTHGSTSRHQRIRSHRPVLHPGDPRPGRAGRSRARRGQRPVRRRRTRWRSC